jgi:hypothetical protein
MTKNWIALNIVFLLVAGSLGWQLHLGIDRFNAQNDVAKIVPVSDLKQTGAQEGKLAPLAQVHRSNATEFSVIPEKNVFSPLRAREAKVDVAAVPETPPLTQKPLLVGVTITGNQRMASIVETGRQTSSSRKSQIKKLGDIYQGYTITDITADQMVLEAGTRKEIIPLHLGSKKSTQTGKTPIVATRVISIGSSTTTGQAAVSSSGGAARSAAGSTAQATPASSARGTRASTAPQSSASTTSDQSSQSGGRSASSQTPAATPASPSQTSPGTSTGDSQGRRVIRTPFGDITRPNTP